jgi:23S rRNA pseudouridine955/2504/2580 synthase
MALLERTQAQVIYLNITAEQAGQRIDNFLQARLKGVPKSHIYRILRGGEVRVNKGRIKPTYRLQEGDSVRVPPVQCATNHTIPPTVDSVKSLTQSVLYEDADLLIINKAAGMAVHGGSGISFGVIEGLRTLYPRAPFLELVHRLDRETSGCLMIAKKASLLRRLHESLRKGEVHKQYVALVQGHWRIDLTEVVLPLRKNILQSGERLVKIAPEGKPSLSQFTVERHFSQATLLNVHPLTGRTHQIRVHTAHSGHPIAGDEKYGDEAFNREMREYGLRRLFLHAAELRVDLPEHHYHVKVRAPLPPLLKQVLQRLDGIHD